MWEPPGRLAYLWHLARDRSDATEVEVTFADADGGTAVTIVHRGWERLGAAGPKLEERAQHGWAAVVPRFEEACRGSRSRPL